MGLNFHIKISGLFKVLQLLYKGRILGLNILGYYLDYLAREQIWNLVIINIEIIFYDQNVLQV